MTILFIALVLLAVVAALLGWERQRRYRRKLERGEIDAMPRIVELKEECCGQHAVCEKESLLAGISKEIEYYNDEELDDYRNIPSDGYPDAAINEFRDVFYTLREEEVAGWVRSLQLRQIELPDPLKEEVYLVLTERRMA